MASGVHETGAAYLVENGVSGKTLKVMLLDASHAFDATDEFVSDIVANELTGGGYARVTISSVTVTPGANSRKFVLDCADASFGALTGHTVAFAVVYVEIAGGDSASKLLFCYDDTNVVTNGGTFVFKPDADDGMLYGT